MSILNVRFLLIICLFFLKIIFANNFDINQSENIICPENFTFVNLTCFNNTLFNLTQQNETIIEFNPCLNISCKEDYLCVQGECLLNLSYNNVDSKIIHELSFNEWQPVIVILKNNNDLAYTSNFIVNRQIYQIKSEYFDQVEKNILFDLNNSGLNEDNFILGHKFSSFPGFSARVTREGLILLVNNSLVANIELNGKGKLLLDNSVPLINADKIWSSILNINNITGLGQSVCVIDSGVNLSHPDLINSVSYEKCFCDELSGPYGCCPNGLIEDEDAEDVLGHGTFVSGIITANEEYKGVAPNSNITAIRITDVFGDYYEGDLIKAIEWCVGNASNYNISVITISLGTFALYNSYCDSNYLSLTNAINSAVESGIFVDVASGNNASLNGMSSPACLSNVTSVGSSNNYGSINITWTEPNPDCTDYFSFADQVSCGSNRASFLDLVAPGAKITSTYKYEEGFNGYGTGLGTSFAAPHVAGVAALMKQANNSITSFDIRSIMKRTGVSVYDPNSTLTFPRVDAYRSVMASIYDSFVSDTELVYSDNNRKVVSFNVFNDLNQTSEMGWNLSLGNNITRVNNNIANLGAYDDLMVFVEYNYTTSGNYIINSTLGTNWQTIPIIVNKEIDIINDSVLCTNCNSMRVFTYNLTSYYGNQVVNWQVDFGDGITSSSLNNFTINENQTIFFFIEHNYSTAQEYTVSATINSTTMREYANNMKANITQLG